MGKKLDLDKISTLINESTLKCHHGIESPLILTQGIHGINTKVFMTSCVNERLFTGKKQIILVTRFLGYIRIKIHSGFAIVKSDL